MSQIINLQPKKEKPKKKKPLKSEIKWKAAEYEHYEKDISWYIVSGLVAAALLVLAIFSNSFLLVALIVLGYFTFISYAARKPDTVKFAVTPRGVVINQTVYDYDNLSSFWISYNPPHIKELSIRSKKKVMPYIKIPLADQNPVEIRATLMQYIPEKKHKESSIDNISKAIRF